MTYQIAIANWWSSNATTQAFSLRHDRKMNMSFVDGHVQSLNEGGLVNLWKSSEWEPHDGSKMYVTYGDGKVSLAIGQ